MKRHAIKEKKFINSEAFTTMRGEIPKWADLFINI